MADVTATGGAIKKPFFEVYKRTQGTYTRLGTAAGGGIMILAGADFLYRKLAFESDAGWTVYLQTGIPLLALIMFGLLLWWLVGANRKTCDFMIATEGEMKKVSWSSRSELIGSTKVVILFTVTMASLLFMVDMIFMVFFNSVGVLRGASPWETLFGV